MEDVGGGVLGVSLVDVPDVVVVDEVPVELPDVDVVVVLVGIVVIAVVVDDADEDDVVDVGVGVDVDVDAVDVDGEEMTNAVEEVIAVDFADFSSATI